MKNGGGHFAPELGGHFKLELGGQYYWNLQVISKTCNSQKIKCFNLRYKNLVVVIIYSKLKQSTYFIE